MRKTFDHRILPTDRWTTEDIVIVVRTSAMLTGSGVNGKKAREVGRRNSRHTVVANTSTCQFFLDTRING